MGTIYRKMLELLMILKAYLFRGPQDIKWYERDDDGAQRYSKRTRKTIPTTGVNFVTMYYVSNE